MKRRETGSPGCCEPASKALMPVPWRCGLCVCCLMIIPAAAKVCPDAGPFLFIPHGRVVQGPIKKLTEDVQEFQFPMELHRAIRESFVLDKARHMISGGRNRPEEMAIGDALCGSPCAKFGVAVLNFGLGHVHQPVI